MHWIDCDPSYATEDNGELTKSKTFGVYLQIILTRGNSYRWNITDKWRLRYFWTSGSRKSMILIGWLYAWAATELYGTLRGISCRSSSEKHRTEGPSVKWLFRTSHVTKQSASNDSFLRVCGLSRFLMIVCDRIVNLLHHWFSMTLGCSRVQVVGNWRSQDLKFGLYSRLNRRPSRREGSA